MDSETQQQKAIAESKIVIDLCEAIEKKCVETYAHAITADFSHAETIATRIHNLCSHHRRELEKTLAQIIKI